MIEMIFTALRPVRSRKPGIAGSGADERASEPRPGGSARRLRHTRRSGSESGCAGGGMQPCSEYYAYCPIATAGTGATLHPAVPSATQ
jgi:hypothetical protein